MAGTVTIPRRQRQVTSEAAPPEPTWRTILFNDDEHPREIVVLAVQQAAGLSLELAEHIVETVERDGQAVVRQGLSQEDAVILAGKLRLLTRAGGRFPGVTATAEQDD
jgi:ATP-dependent Clp protease adapter protein ClpS